MIVMPSNNSGIQVGYLAGKYPGRIGWLLSPDGWRKPPGWMSYALDNGAFGAWVNKRPWNAEAFRAHIEKSKTAHKPSWVVVPDVVTDMEATIISWHEWSPQLRAILPNVPLAFAVQDGMTPCHVPKDADVIFVGGTTEWKWRNLYSWTDNFPRVHVGRVNSERMLWMAHDAGAESCDGTGWMRGGEERLDDLVRYLEESTTGRKQAMLFEDQGCPECGGDLSFPTTDNWSEDCANCGFSQNIHEHIYHNPQG
jgi:hypothetical protein